MSKYGFLYFLHRCYDSRHDVELVAYRHEREDSSYEGENFGASAGADCGGDLSVVPQYFLRLVVLREDVSYLELLENEVRLFLRAKVAVVQLLEQGSCADEAPEHRLDFMHVRIFHLLVDVSAHCEAGGHLEQLRLKDKEDVRLAAEVLMALIGEDSLAEVLFFILHNHVIIRVKRCECPV